MLGRLDDKDMGIFDSAYIPPHEQQMRRFIGEQLQGDRSGACTPSSSSTDAQRNTNCAGVHATATKGPATALMQPKATSYNLSKHQTQPPPCRPPLHVPAPDLNLNLITALVDTDSGERIVPIYEVTNAVTEMPTARTRSIASQIAKEFTHAINHDSNSSSNSAFACVRACDGIAPEPLRLGLGQGERGTTDTPSHGKCIFTYIYVYMCIHIYCVYMCVYIYQLHIMFSSCCM